MEYYVCHGIRWRVGKSGGLARLSKRNHWYPVEHRDPGVDKVADAIFQARAYRLTMHGYVVPDEYRGCLDYRTAMLGMRGQNKWFRQHLRSLARPELRPFAERFTKRVLAPVVRRVLLSIDAYGDVVRELRDDAGGSAAYASAVRWFAKLPGLDFEEWLATVVATERAVLEQKQWAERCRDAGAEAEAKADEYYGRRQDALDKLIARVADCTVPTVDMVRERLGYADAERYRAALEMLENHPDPEFNVEPRFADCANMNTVTMESAVRAVALLACGDVDEITETIETDRERKLRYKRGWRERKAQAGATTTRATYRETRGMDDETFGRDSF
jgi:hypothetical protein